MLASSFLSKNKVLLIIFLIFFILDLILGGFASYLYFPKITSLIYQDQNKSPLITQIIQNASKKRSTKEYAEYISTVSQLATETNNISVNNCELTPKMVKADKSSTITFQNTGTKTAFITLARQEPLRIEASSSSSTSLIFVEGTPSIIGIGCSGEKDASGILYIPR